MQDPFEEIFNKRLGVIKPGLERVQAALNILRKNEEKTAELEEFNVLVGGTNGKGSVSSFLWMLLSLGDRHSWGLFNSPHLCNFRERYRVSAKDVGDEDLIRSLNCIKAELGPRNYEDLSFFEIATILAYRLFRDEGVNRRIFEVGLGGRLDSTNIFDPDLSVITSISYDHMDVLGNSLKEIFIEKLGITRPGRRLVWGNSGDVTGEPETLKFLEKYCHDKGIALYTRNKDFGHTEDKLFAGGSEYRFPDFLKNAPAYLRDNFSVSLFCYDLLSRQSLQLEAAQQVLPKFDNDSLLVPPALAGRFQRIDLDKQKIIIDVAHNLHGLHSLVAQLSKSEQSFGFIVSILRDKDYLKMIALLQNSSKFVIFYEVEGHRSPDREDILTAYPDMPYANNFAQALDLAKKNWPEQMTRVVCGSVYATGKVFEYLERDPCNTRLASLFGSGN